MRNSKGQFIKGHRSSPNTEFRKGEHHSTATEFKKGVQFEQHPQWKGEKAGYHALHKWIVRVMGKPSICSKCGTTEAKRFDWANISGEYKRDINDWQRLCVICHAREHENWRHRWLA